MGGYAILGHSSQNRDVNANAVAMRGQPEAVISFFGDGAMNQGAFHEALNMAGLWHLPILFVCENNHYAIGTEVHRHSAVPELYKRAAAYNIPAERVDGMDVLKVYEAARHALASIRRGGGPQFIEFETYRYRAHSMADPDRHRPAIELQAYQAHDPVSAAIRNFEFRYPSQKELAAASADGISRLAQHMVDAGHAHEAEVEALKKEVQAIVDDAAQFAAASPQPTMDAAWRALNCNRHQEVLI